MKLTIVPSDRDGKKWKAVFSDGAKTKTLHFGAKGYEDYTQSKDLSRKKLYIDRHAKRENWQTPYTAGSLSRWILWETPSFQKNVLLFKKRFGLD